VVLLGAAPEIGQPGDDITGLIPWRDDYLLFGCRDSFWILRGDPGFGGRMDVLFRGCGLLTQEAHAFDHRGGLYFLAPGGLMYLAQGSSRPVEIARERLGDVLSEVDLTTTRPSMAFDVQRTLLYVYLTPTNGSTNVVHVVYDPMSEDVNVDGGVFLDAFGTVGHQPRAVVSVVAENDDDRQVLLGCQDGFVRRFSDTQLTDDGTTIDAWVKMSPLEVGDGAARGMLHELQCTLNAGSGPVAWRLQGASSAVEANAIDIGTAGLAAGTWGSVAAGFQQPVRLRHCAGALQVTLRQQTTVGEIHDRVRHAQSCFARQRGSDGRGRFDTGGQRRNRAAVCCADVLYWWANNECRGQSFDTDCGWKFCCVVVYFWLVFVHHLQRDGTRKSCKERADRRWLCANAGRV